MLKYLKVQVVGEAGQEQVVHLVEVGEAEV
jgi:hypothetical protein